MERVNRILQHKDFQTYMKTICKQEQTRQFCLHGIEHSLAVARIGYIKNLEQQLSIKKDVIYAAALLHDIGRSVEYTVGTSHHEAGAELAYPILVDCGYLEFECDMICAAIRQHKKKSGEDNALSLLLYEADKQSRNCFACNAKKLCYWPDEKKNDRILF